MNTVELLDSEGASYSIDLIRSGNGKKLDLRAEEHVARIISYSDKADDDYDVIFITNPTSCHYETVVKYSLCTKSMFIEKPVFDRTDLILPEFCNDKIMYVACPLRYSSVINYIKSNIDYKKTFSVRAISSSYLPDWRPGTDYRLTYSAHKALGGGVSIDLIHEWDYIISMFGFPDKVMSLIKKNSDLVIDSDDTALYIGDYKDKTVEIHLDYFGRKTIRNLELYMNDETIVGDLVSSQVKFLKSGKIIELNEERNVYQKRELRHFFNIVNGVDKNDSNVDDAIKTLKIAKGENL